MGFLDRFKPTKPTESGHYGQLYDRLIDSHLQESGDPTRALQEAVGGDFETFGRIERDLLLTLGWQPEHFLIDLGCGSGRLARKLAPLMTDPGGYLGLDVNPSLLEQARKEVAGSPSRRAFRFELVREPRLPSPDRSADWVVAFSVATHIDLEESYSYLAEIKRVLKPDAQAVVSYLCTEIEGHWQLFLKEAAIPAEERRNRVRNHVMVPGTLNRLAEKAGLVVIEDIPADRPFIRLTEEVEMDGTRHPPGGNLHLGQACLLVRPG